MTYISVDVDAGEVLNELDIDDVISYVIYNTDNEVLLREIDEDSIVDYLVSNGNLVFTDYTIIKDFLEKKDAYGLMNFVHKVYNTQMGELYESTN